MDALVESSPGTSAGGAVWRALDRLDALLERAVAAAQVAYGPAAAGDPFRGLHLGPDDVARLLAREPGAPTLAAGNLLLPDALADPPESGGRLSWLAREWALSPFDLDLVLVALAPEVDLRYERLYAYLQDDVSRRRPSVDLALNLLCTSAEARLARRAHFAADAPLVGSGLLHVVADAGQGQPPLLAHYLKLDDQIVDFLLGQTALDRRLATCADRLTELPAPSPLPGCATLLPALFALARQAAADGQPLRLHFHGPDEASRLAAAGALAAALGQPLLRVDLRRVAAATDGERLLSLACRQARLDRALLYVDGLETLRIAEHLGLAQHLQRAVAALPGGAILAGTPPWAPPGRWVPDLLEVPFPLPDFAGRRACWEAELAAARVAITAPALDALADRFRLTSAQIAAAVAAAGSLSLWRAAQQADTALAHSHAGPTRGDLFAAARAQSGHELATLTVKIEPLYTWDDIVLPEDLRAQLRELCQRVSQRHRVLGAWGFARKLSLGKGVSALFAGPSGTGKTMAAEIIAGELGLDLYKIDVSSVVSKYIGETEQNLDRIFTASEQANAILFFDEADALFGKRSEVRDAHDRYANIEIAYLLQKMEHYEGVTILATNLRGNLDESFTRRLSCTLHFPLPDEPSRRAIWGRVWPAELPLADDVDLDFLTRRFKLSGGNIRNVALAAAFLAADAGSGVTMAHLLQAVQREYQKMGKLLSPAELQPALVEATP